MHYEYSNWRNKSWGLHDVERSEGSGVLAYRSDGAKYTEYRDRYFSYYVLPGSDQIQAEIVLPRENMTILVLPSLRAYFRKGRLFGGWPVWSNDDSCGKGTASPGRSVRGERIVGFETIRHEAADGSRGKTTVWLAPKLGCMETRQIQIEVNSFGLPTAYSRREVVRIHLGEPDPALFTPPKGYREVGVP